MRFYIPLIFVCSCIAISCGSSPKIIVEDSTTNEMPKMENSSDQSSTEMSNAMHQVIAIEVLEAERYTYLRVIEKLDTFWIASNKIIAKVGNEYFYQGGLLKTDFISQEHDRVFEKIFLVSRIIEASNHSNVAQTGSVTDAASQSLITPKEIKGATKLDELLTNKARYNGTKITISGECVRANYEIMGKNWYHIQDGTKNGTENFDLTVTSQENIPLGANVAFEGKIELNKDFGAGYSYDIILEDAIIVR